MLNLTKGTLVNFLKHIFKKFYLYIEMYSPPKPSSLRCEGYWAKGYNPQPALMIWWEKPEWLRKSYAVEKYLLDTGQFAIYRGIAPSRLVKGQLLGNCEFIDKEWNMCWPQFYIQHYIETYNVMPTEAFYNYILNRYANLPPEYQ